jgi:hypothetical protein
MPSVRWCRHTGRWGLGGTWKLLGESSWLLSVMDGVGMR